MIAAVQQGISKKSNKPYAMLTLEDLEGSVQVLCMNENYDKFKELFVENKAILVVGEVNTGEDKPKLFPQDILPLEEAPKRFTKQVHFKLNAAHLNPDLLRQAFDISQSHAGRCPLFLCIKLNGGELVFIEAHEHYRVTPSIQLQHDVDVLFGEDTYYARVDTTTPERVQRRWEKKSSSEGEE